MSRPRIARGGGWRGLRLASAPVAALAVWAAACGDAVAADALRGKRLYLDVGRLTGAGASCVDCHGGLPGGAFGIERAANSPQLIENAVNSIPPMARFRGRLAAADFADLAAYIGNPAMASPEPRLTSTAPAGGSAGIERVDFGEVAAPASARATVNVVNAGQAPLRLTGAPRIEGPDAADFVITAADCSTGLQLVGQQACRIDVDFRPSSGGGLRKVALRIEHDWIGGRLALALLGTASAASGPPAAAAPPLGEAAAGGGGALDAAALVLLAALLACRLACPLKPPLGVDSAGHPGDTHALRGGEPLDSVDNRCRQATPARTATGSPTTRGGG